MQREPCKCEHAHSGTGLGSQNSQAIRSFRLLASSSSLCRGIRGKTQFGKDEPECFNFRVAGGEVSCRGVMTGLCSTRHCCHMHMQTANCTCLPVS